MATTREQIHQLVDQIPEADLPAARRALEDLAHRPNLTEILANAPVDDEPLTPEDEAAIQEGLSDIAAGRVASTEELRRNQTRPALARRFE